jgi:hypothetical protein
MATSTKDFSGIIQAVYDPTSEALQVNLVGSGSPTLPNVVRLSDGTAFLTSTDIGPKVALDVSIANIPEILISDTTDSIKIGNGSGTYMSVNADGSTNSIEVNSIVPFEYDSIYATFPNGFTEVYSYKKTATTVATVTVTYTDTSKTLVLSVVRT